MGENMKDDTGTRKVCNGGACAQTCPVYELGGICMTPVEVAKFWAARKQLLADLNTLVD
jgi:hypothetical protein